MLRNEGERLTRVVVSTPSKEYFDVSDTDAHNMNEVADRDATIAQHTALQETLALRGAEVIDAPSSKAIRTPYSRGTSPS